MANRNMSVILAFQLRIELKAYYAQKSSACSAECDPCLLRRDQRVTCMEMSFKKKMKQKHTHTRVHRLEQKRLSARLTTELHKRSTSDPD